MTALRRIGSSDLEVFPLCLGGNVFGWTADEAASREVLDAYVGAGGNFIDTADSYSAFAKGNHGGESEQILGPWLKGRSDREQLVVATKVSQHPDFPGLAPSNIKAALDASLTRLKSEHIDLYYAHYDSPEIPIEDIAGTFSEAVDAGKVRYIGISNFSPERIAEWMAAAIAGGLHAPVALQPHYNLVERDYEESRRVLAERHQLGVMPYLALAKGFLTGKYRPGVTVDSPRAGGAEAYLTPEGLAVLDALDAAAAAHGASVTAVSLAWLAAQPTITAPIASARTLEQLPDLLASVDLELTPEELSALSSAGR